MKMMMTMMTTVMMTVMMTATQAPAHQALPPSMNHLSICCKMRLLQQAALASNTSETQCLCLWHFDQALAAVRSHGNWLDTAALTQVQQHQHLLGLGRVMSYARNTHLHKLSIKLLSRLAAKLSAGYLSCHEGIRSSTHYASISVRNSRMLMKVHLRCNMFWILPAGFVSMFWVTAFERGSGHSFVMYIAQYSTLQSVCTIVFRYVASGDSTLCCHLMFAVCQFLPTIWSIWFLSALKDFHRTWGNCDVCFS